MFFLNKEKVIILTVSFFLFATTSAFCQLRSFNSIFPNLNAEEQTKVFSEEGLIRYSRNATSNSLTGGASSGIPSQITNNILNRNPGYYIESINVFPCNSRNLTILDIYNALGNIRGLKGIPYYSETRSGLTPLFEDATRVASQSSTAAVRDPAPASVLPASETIYIRLKDANFGNTFYRCEINPSQNGLSYSLTNYRNITYLFVTAIRAEQFTAQLYIEPIAEGILIYSIAGVDISDFISNRIHINSAIAKRLGVMTTWASSEILKRIN